MASLSLTTLLLAAIGLMYGGADAQMFGMMPGMMGLGGGVGMMGLFDDPYSSRQDDDDSRGGYSGFGHYGMGAGMGYYDGPSNNGVLKDEIKINMNLQTISIENLPGFTSLSQLAGRGVAVCSDHSYDWDWKTTCEGPFFACCALKYDDTDQIIHVYDDPNGAY